MNEEILFVGSVLAGSLLTIAIDRLVKPVFSKASRNTLSSYDSVKTELNSLVFERNLVSESAIRVGTAFNENRIDVYERDKLLKRYTTEIEEYDEKIDKYQNLLDFADLQNQRDNLTEMMNRRISSIDQRLKDIHNKFAITYGNAAGDRIEQVLEEAVEEAVHDNPHHPRRLDESNQFRTSALSTQDLSQRVDDGQPDVRQLEELHHQIVLELDRLENDKKKDDDINPTERKDDLQDTNTPNQGENYSRSLVGNDKEATKVEKETTANALAEDRANES